MIVACTGPEDPKPGMSEARLRVQHALRSLNPERLLEFRTGAAFGIDSACYHYAVFLFRHAEHRVFVPQGQRYNQELVALARQEGHDIVGVPGGYLKRDDALVDGATLLLAFPETMNEVLRSGTWSTIRRAWKRDITVMYFPLDNKPGPVVRCT